MIFAGETWITANTRQTTRQHHQVSHRVRRDGRVYAVEDPHEILVPCVGCGGQLDLFSIGRKFKMLKKLGRLRHCPTDLHVDGAMMW